MIFPFLGRCCIYSHLNISKYLTKNHDSRLKGQVFIPALHQDTVQISSLHLPQFHIFKGTRDSLPQNVDDISAKPWVEPSLLPWLCGEGLRISRFPLNRPHPNLWMPAASSEMSEPLFLAPAATSQPPVSHPSHKHVASHFAVFCRKPRTGDELW